MGSWMGRSWKTKLKQFNYTLSRHRATLACFKNFVCDEYELNSFLFSFRLDFITFFACLVISFFVFVLQKYCLLQQTTTVTKAQWYNSVITHIF